MKKYFFIVCIILSGCISKVENTPNPPALEEENPVQETGSWNTEINESENSTQTDDGIQKGLMFTTIDYCLLDRWYYTISETAPKLSQHSKVVKKQYFLIPVFFFRYGLDENNFTNIKIDYLINKPDGSVYLDEKQLQGSNHQIGNPNYILMTDVCLTVCFEPEDDYGIYEIIVTVHDENLNESYQLCSEIELIEYNPFKYTIDKNEINEWIFNYYDNPTPYKAVPAFLYYSQILTDKELNGFPNVLSFFLELFSNNEYLIPVIIDQNYIQDEKTRYFFIYLLANLDNQEAADFTNSLEGDERRIANEAKSYELIKVDGRISDASQLDALWNMFFAGGGYQPVLKLVNQLGRTDAFILSAAAKWSIGSLCEQKELVRNYCRWIYQYENILPAVRSELGDILGVE